MKKVIVIGNSPSILKNKLGKVIDSYDIVIRLNHCPTKGYEKYIGNKFNIWATTKNKEHNNFVPDNYSELLEVWYRTPVSRKRMQDIPEKDENGEELNIPSKLLFKNRKGVERDGRFKHFFYGHGNVRDTKHEPDTGLLTILQAIRQFDDVTIHGFDFYQESEGFIQGYYREKQKDAHGKHPEDRWWEMNKKTKFASKEVANVKNKIIDELINNHGLKVLEKTNGDK